MLNSMKISSTVLLCLSGAAALSIAPPEGCRLTIENVGTTQSPSYEFECQGDCVTPQKNPCKVGSIRFRSDENANAVLWECYCDGDDINLLDQQACTANVNDGNGSWDIICGAAQCTNPCVEAALPVSGGSTVFACTCPDV